MKFSSLWILHWIQWRRPCHICTSGMLIIDAIACPTMREVLKSAYPCRIWGRLSIATGKMFWWPLCRRGCCLDPFCLFTLEINFSYSTIVNAPFSIFLQERYIEMLNVCMTMHLRTVQNQVVWNIMCNCRSESSDGFSFLTNLTRVDLNTIMGSTVVLYINNTN